MDFVANLGELFNFLTQQKFGFTFLDLVIFLVIIFYAIEGIYIGFVQALFDLLSFILSFLFALKSYGLVGKFIALQFAIPHGFANAFGFFIAALLAEVILSLILRYVLSYVPKDILNARVNRSLGFVPGIISAFILLSFLVTLVVSMPSSPLVKKAIASSKIGSLLVVKTSFLEKKLNDVFGGAINETLNFLTVKPQSDEFVRLNFKIESLKPDDRSEQEMFELVNKERVKSGLSELVFDASLQAVARAHSEDMLKRGYFSHYTPEGLSPFDRMASANISYTTAGENLAFAPSVSLAHQGLMDSPGHRANILSSQFGRIGIGVIDGGIFGLMFTQTFTD